MLLTLLILLYSKWNKLWRIGIQAASFSFVKHLVEFSAGKLSSEIL